MPKKTIPIEALAQLPMPGMAIPGSITFSPDDSTLLYLWSPERSLSLQMFACDLQSGQRRLLLGGDQGGVTEENLSPEEKLRRERQRQMSLGVTQYAWAAKSPRLLIPLGGDFYIKDDLEAGLRKIDLPSTGGPAIAPQLSPDGKWLAYVQDAELHVVPVEGGSPRRLTFGARETGKTNGLAEFVAQEEMSRFTGFWWSPDSTHLAFEEVDETHIPIYRIVHQGKDTPTYEDHRYPFAGQANAKVRLGVVPVEGGDPVWMDLGPEEDIYLARVQWFSGQSLVVQLENRAQTQLDLLDFNPATGQSRLVLRETSEIWINLHDILRTVKMDGELHFLWASERSGFRHLYLYNLKGECLRQLTSGEWMVDALAGVDEVHQLVYFTATRESPLESHLYAVPLAGGEIIRLTHEPGMHTVVLDHACRRFVDTCTVLEHPPVVTLRALEDGRFLADIFSEPDPRLEEYDLPAPEIVQIVNRMGDLLYGAVYRPPQEFGPGPYPAIVYVYGGPHAQLVTNAWGTRANLRAQYLRSLGFVVFVLDNRGMARRGLKFESAIWRNMGNPEVDDQVDGVSWLVAQGLADPERVGIYGWSYGGYMASLCLGRAPETFKVAVAGAPVTHYDGYDTHYTERYMGTPQEYPEAYRQGSVMEYVDQITGKLMIVHGLIDENVHFRHTARLINALIRARKPYELFLLPDERHSPRSPADRVYLEERIVEFFVKNLMKS